ncbi:MAG: response regulator transcription factor [Candidatus Latescibacteria bacterium]|nr:response regulator transcription factor [Candidatus Latescibacterota bacterium]
MHVLIAEDDVASRLLLTANLRQWGYEVIAATNGQEALEVLERPDPPMLAVLDWMMPLLDGVEVCRRVRANPALKSTYLILLTAKDTEESVVEGLDAGANDYVVKPFKRRELQARIQVGTRVVQLQSELVRHVAQLETALRQVKELQGLLPICSYCKRVRDDHDYWEQIDTYVAEHSKAEFSHGICPDCYEKVVKPELERFLEQGNEGEKPTAP